MAESPLSAQQCRLEPAWASFSVAVHRPRLGSQSAPRKRWGVGNGGRIDEGVGP